MRLAQPIDYVAVVPPIILALSAAAALLTGLFSRRAPQATAAVALAGSAAAFGTTIWLAAGPSRHTLCFPGGCSYVVDAYTGFFDVLFLAALAVVLLLSIAVVADDPVPVGEYYALLLTSVTGMLVLAGARDLLSLVIALELVTLPAFVLVGLRRGDPRAAEAALKFFLFSIISTGLTVYGMALLYGVTGSLGFARIAAVLARLHGHPSAMAATAAAAAVLVLVGFAFKIAAVPFHSWAPDTYEGSSVPVAAFLSVASKAAGFAGLLLLLTSAFAPYADVWGPVIAALAAASMTVGNVVALSQTNVVRLLAWSTVAHAGYLLVPLGLASADHHGRAALHAASQATLAYLGVYAAMNLGAFCCVGVVSRRSRRRSVDEYRGLVHRMPVVAAVFAVFLTALAGLPPGVAGLFAKVVVLRAAVHGHVTWLAVVAAVNTVIGLAYYLPLAARMFTEPGPDVEPSAPRWRRTTAVAALSLTLAAVAVLSVDPQPLLRAAGLAAG